MRYDNTAAQPPCPALAPRGPPRRLARGRDGCASGPAQGRAVNNMLGFAMYCVLVYVAHGMTMSGEG